MTPQEKPSALLFALGIAVAFILFQFGRFTARADTCNDNKLSALHAISAELDTIGTTLDKRMAPEKKDPPLCSFIKKEDIARIRHGAGTNLEVCKHLIGGTNGDKNLYDEIDEWASDSGQLPNGQTDKIMSHVLLTMYWCFSNT